MGDLEGTHREKHKVMIYAGWEVKKRKETEYFRKR